MTQFQCSAFATFSAAVALSICFTSAVGQTTATWLNAENGNWTDGTKWSTNPAYPDNVSPSLLYNAVIDAAGPDYVISIGQDITVSQATLNSATARVRVQSGTFTALNGLLLNQGVFQLSGGTLADTIVNGTGGIIRPFSGTLDQVEINSQLTLPGNSNITVRNGTEINGTISFEASNNAAELNFEQDFTLPSGAKIIFANGSSNHVAMSDHAIVVAAGAEVGTTGGKGSITSEILIINNGLVSADSAGNYISLTAPSVENHGTLEASNSSQLNIKSLLNEGSLSVSEGAFLHLTGSWQNNETISVNASTISLGGTPIQLGSISATNATINVGSALTLAQLQAIDATNTTIRFMPDSTIDNTNSVMVMNAGTNVFEMAGGTIVGGTVTTENDAEFQGTGGTLHNVLVDADYRSYSAVTIRGVVTLANGHTTVRSASPNLSGARFEFWHTGGVNQLRAESGILTIEPNIIVRTRDANGTLGDASHGLIVRGWAHASSGTLTLEGSQITNEGRIEAGSNNTIVIPNAAGLTNLYNGTLTGGIWQVGAYGTMDLTGAQITTNAASVYLYGQQAQFDALNSLTRNAGTLQIGGDLSSSPLEFTTPGNLENDGTLIATTGGTIVVSDDFTQSDSGILDIGVRTPSVAIYQYDTGLVDVFGHASLDGTLQLIVHGAPPYNPPFFNNGPQLGDEITIMNYESYSGEFDAVTGQQIYQNYYFELEYTDNGLVLVVSQAGPGDSDFDGDVDLNDLSVLAANYGGQFFKQWHQGDYDGDGDVDLNDLGVLAANYGSGEAQAFADFAAIASVPEPGVSVAALFSGASMLRRKRAA